MTPKVKSVPWIFPAFLLITASAAAEEAGGSNRTVIDKLIMKSCKAAVKAHDRLSELEIDDLMSKLADCENPYSCPHGRPTFIRVTAYDIERSFKRK